ncbi:MFS general substrate transporter [Sistotremastrum suecicum HHB10207 ss-3]|uniref:MFS general substrate transporter n=1 Tax=Sistotremastrum suecicum HHB10207 ss-3 TaxID=1314776 RepID=A0A165Y1K3_9AGAM|nr:MFS general substrate transporter [Sistotremastrum suecicum HHB10207 ss-3]
MTTTATMIHEEIAAPPRALRSNSTAKSLAAQNGDDIELPTILTSTESRSSSPKHPDPSHISTAKTPAIRQKAHIQFFALCYSIFLAGWNDGTTGPLLPTIQRFYHVGFAVVSILFICNCVGFISGAALNVFLTDKFGFGKTIVLGSICQTIGYAVQAPAPPFPVLALGYVINGFGISLQDAQANGFVASLQENAAAKMGILHAAYGGGALISPLVATHFASQKHWSFHFLCSCAIAFTNTILLVWVFRFKTQNEALAEIGEASTETDESQQSKYSQIWKTKNVHLLAAFILVYVGVEVTTGGWIVTYIIQERGGGPSSGYISSGFFGGLTVGRLALLWVNKTVGERRVIWLYSILAIALELTIWFVPSLIGNAVAVSIIGVLLGPMYPIVMNYAGWILPGWLLTGAIGWIAGFGQAGSAILPFLTGMLASKFGIHTLQPLLVAMMALMIGLWWLVPPVQRRTE